MRPLRFVPQLVAFAVMAVLLAPAAFAQYTGTVNFSSTLQQIDGFGVAATFGRPWFIQSASGSVPSQVVDQLFNPVTGAGLTMLRMGIDDVVSGSPTDSGSAANSGILIVNTAPSSCGVTPAYTWDGSAGGEVWLGQQAVKYGLKRFYADSWGAPGYMKTNNNLYSGGVVCDGTSATSSATQCAKPGFSDCRAAYANYLVQFIKDFQHDGVPITDLDWVNEPNTNTASYASMTPTSAEAITFIDAYAPIVAASGINVNQMCCDIYNWNTANTYNTAVVNDPTANPYVNVYTAHEYGHVASFVLNTGNPPKKNWMTEWGPQSPQAYNPTWDEVYAGTSNNYNNGMFVANDISNALINGGISSYLYWYADSTGATGAMIQMGASYQASSFVVTKRLHALAHFARFVRPGAYEVPISTNTPACTSQASGVYSCLTTTAFINADGTKVINVVNNFSSPETLSVTLDAATSGWVPTSYFTDENDTLAPTTAASVNGTMLSATLAPRSMTSITLAPPVTAGTVQLILTPSLFAEGDGTFLGTVTVTNVGTGTAQNMQLNSASLGSVAGSTLPTAPMPYSIGNIAPGSSEVFYVNFPAGPTPGNIVIEKYAGTYTSSSGAGNFGASTRAMVPSLPWD